MVREEPLRPWLHLGIVFGVCVPFWAGVAWLLSAWL
jgi:hypothetical protein